MQKEDSSLQNLEKALGYTFKEVSYLILALTHSSYANEHRREKMKHNERLEFLGDAVLETVSSDVLYKAYPDMQEGKLSKLRASLVCEPTLALCAHEFSLSRYLLLGNGEEMNGGRYRDSVVSDALEAVIGAIYLDGGFNAANAFIRAHIMNDIDEKQLFIDSKTNLQEIVQAFGHTVDYELVGEDGPDHDKTFTVTASVDKEVMGRGTGHTKKAAEQHAAYQAIKKIKGL